MRKVTIAILALFLVVAVMDSVFAVSFELDNNPSSFTRISSDTNAQGTDWKLSWTSSNLGGTGKLTMSVKIYSAPGVYASHTFIYSSASTASHDYLSSISNGSNVYMAAKYKSGSGTIHVKGGFNP